MKTPNWHRTPSIILILGLLFGCLNTYAETDCSTVTEISQVECESLLQLYHSSNGPNWNNNEGWNITNTPCSWYGITSENNGVVEINLLADSNLDYENLGNNLVGTLPDFKGLPNLQTLNLSYNELTGSIPNFSSLPNLQGLYLSKNQLTGKIPDFSNMPRL